jgi:hypothetical protein
MVYHVQGYYYYCDVVTLVSSTRGITQIWLEVRDERWKI